MYFFFVEAKGLTLDELDAICETRDHPRRASTQRMVLRAGDLAD